MERRHCYFHIIILSIYASHSTSLALGTLESVSGTAGSAEKWAQGPRVWIKRHVMWPPKRETGYGWGPTGIFPPLNSSHPPLLLSQLSSPLTGHVLLSLTSFEVPQVPLGFKNKGKLYKGWVWQQHRPAWSGQLSITFRLLLFLLHVTTLMWRNIDIYPRTLMSYLIPSYPELIAVRFVVGLFCAFVWFHIFMSFFSFSLLFFSQLSYFSYMIVAYIVYEDFVFLLRLLSSFDC